MTELEARIEALSEAQALRALRSVAHAMEPNAEVVEALERYPGQAVAALRESIDGHIEGEEVGQGEVARAALRLAASEMPDPTIVDEAIRRASKNGVQRSLADPLSTAGGVALALFVLRSNLEISWDREQGFCFRLIHRPVSDKLAARVLRGVLGVFRDNT